MPDKLCRTCGGDLIKWTACTECKKVTQKICTTCSVKTIEEFHSHHIDLEPYQMANTKNTIATIQSYHDPQGPKIPKKRKNYGNNILAISGIITGIIILGVFSMYHTESFSNTKPSEIKAIIPSENQDITQNVNQVHQVDTSHISADNSAYTKYTYNDCLGVSDGMHLTITCPTTYGIVYKAVVQIPSELMSQFENNIFNMRGLSVTEHTDSISIQYAKKMYEVKFINS